MSRYKLYILFTAALMAVALAACGPDKTKTGQAVNMTGNAEAGKQVYVDFCASCHGPEGTGGVPNPGSDDGTVPALNPIDEEFNSVATMDLVIEHGSTPEGSNPSVLMPAFGDKKLMTPQQIADVMAYILSLSK